MNSIHGKHSHHVLLSAALTRILRGKLCDELMAGRTSISFEKDETLFDAGEDNESVFFLQSGMVKVGVVTERGREIIYDLRKAGDVAGELCLCGTERRTDRAVALEPTKAVSVRYVEILAALRANADLLPRLLELFCQDGSVIVVPAKGDGTFGTPAVFLQGATPGSLAVGDINKDGKLDLVATIPYVCADFMCPTGTINVLLGKGNGTFQTPLSQVVASGVESPVLADVNGDGTLDLMVLGGINFAVLLPGNGDGTFQAPQYYSAGANSLTVAIADFNGDGKPDAVTPGGVLLNIGAPDFSLYLASVTPNPIPGGRSGKGAVTVGSDNGFDGSISLTCSVQPATAMAPTCSLSPISTHVSSGESLNSTLTISTTSSTSSLISPADRRTGAWQSFLMGLPVAGLALIGVGLISRRSRKEQVWAFALASIALSTLAFQMACGGGNTSHGMTGTPPGTYNVTINGSSGSIQHTTTLGITVQ